MWQPQPGLLCMTWLEILNKLVFLKNHTVKSHSEMITQL